MAHVTLNGSCNILTGLNTKNPRAKAEITIPRLRANLSPAEAERLAADLTTAVTIARGIEAGTIATDGKTLVRR